VLPTTKGSEPLPTFPLFLSFSQAFALGLLGTSIKLPPVYQGYFQIFLGIYLFGIAGNLLNLHPFFRHFVLTPPKFILRLARKISQKNLNQSLRPTIYDLPVRQADLLSPVLLGGLTIFLPCATTQAMEVLALSSGDPFYSAAIMFAFTLGTIPTFLAFGFILSKGQTSFQKHFPLLLGTFLLAMSLYTVNSGIGLSGSVYTSKFWQVASVFMRDNPRESHTTLKTQTTTINVSNNGYSPSNITLKKNIPTQLKLITTNVANCSRSFTIPIK
jgi:sulfite exporter TauE/SafE